MVNQLSREQANKLLPKGSTPHDSRFVMKDIKRELSYKYPRNEKAFVDYEKMEPKADKTSQSLLRKDVEKGNHNKFKLDYYIDNDVRAFLIIL